MVEKTLMGPFSLEDELWREYEFCNTIYRIDNPKELYFSQPGTTHRVVDSAGIVHCVPSPGSLGCVLRWFVKEGCSKVAF